MNTLSVAIITKNEERNLPDCLGSVSFADEIVVVDSGSTDRTVDIARAYGCRVFVEEWKGYGPQKNSAVDKCSHEWVLIVDADERIPAETGDVIRMLIDENDGADAYSFPRKNYLRGRWIRRCGWWPDRTIRLVRRGNGRFQSTTHERWVTSGLVASTQAHIDHFIFSSYSEMLRVMEGRSTVMANELFISGRRIHCSAPLSHGTSMFVKVYFLQRGFLEGLDGLVIALTRAGGSFFKYAKLLELQRGFTHTPER